MPPAHRPPRRRAACRSPGLASSRPGGSGSRGRPWPPGRHLAKILDFLFGPREGAAHQHLGIDLPGLAGFDHLVIHHAARIDRTARPGRPGKAHGIDRAVGLEDNRRIVGAGRPRHECQHGRAERHSGQRHGNGCHGRILAGRRRIAKHGNFCRPIPALCGPTGSHRSAKSAENEGDSNGMRIA